MVWRLEESNITRVSGNLIYYNHKLCILQNKNDTSESGENKKEETSSFQKRTFNETRGLYGTFWNIEVFNSED